MKHTNLTGKAFQKAHLALVKRNSSNNAAAQNKVADLVNAILTAVGILLGMALLLWAAETGLARGAAWHVGNYADRPAWND